MSECQKCGECCKQVNIGTFLPDELTELLSVHYGYRVDRVGLELKHRCRHLTEDGRCDDYENRPEYCRKFMCSNPGQLIVKVEM